jgi:hypothetical protein
MTRLEALKDLKAKVEAADFTPKPGGHVMPSYRSFVELADIALPHDVRALDFLAHDAYSGSIDAAKALHEAVLPGWDAQVHLLDRGVEVFDGHMFAGYSIRLAAHAETPARSWLLVILSALIAQEEQT